VVTPVEFMAAYPPFGMCFVCALLSLSAAIEDQYPTHPGLLLSPATFLGNNLLKLTAL